MEKIKLENVRISFPSIFKKSVFEGIEGKYEATFLISKDDKKTIELLNNSIQSIIEQFKLKIPKEKICLKDGDFSNYDGYENCFSLKAASLKRPIVINRDKSPILEEDEIIYAGCYVNAIIDFWIQNNKYGKRVNANLYGIQFLKDGDPFIKTNNEITNDFEHLEELEENEKKLNYSEITFP